MHRQCAAPAFVTPMLARFTNFSPMPFVNGIKAASRAPTMSELEFLRNESAGA
jgi:hypothetical protein